MDVTSLTFGDQEGEVEKNGNSKTIDFHVEVKPKWDHDNEGRTIFPPNFNFEFVIVGEEEVERGDEVEVADNMEE
ncbi:hypothetical protein SLEP1_g24805 [Rubroshorea leprosula]|uniref:Uncharacterized protein n=1 Tax=Rubroshorea leprosula TaxID=152421 RepID=A0AAV5JQJ8_9ROSI|nr:hypothetical protein SLEP1_g24805 [Rubroshorea leprosula]